MQRRTCAGHRKDGQPCKGPAVTGSPMCRMHLGQKVAVHKAVVAIQQRAATYGMPRKITGTTALQEEIWYSAGHVAWLREQVAALEPDALTWGVAEVAHKQATEFGGTDTTEKAALNVWLEAYHRERRYLLDVSKAALAAGVEERLVQLAEAQGLAVVAVLARVFDRLQLTEAQRALAATAVPEELRAQSAV